jgi:PAS domain-containing protein
VPQRIGVTAFLNSLDSTMRAFFDAETHLLILLDRNGCIARVNPAFEYWLDRAERDVLGKEFVALLYGPDLTIFIHAFDKRCADQPFHLLHREAGTVAVCLETFQVIVLNRQQCTLLILRLAA